MIKSTSSKCCSIVVATAMGQRQNALSMISAEGDYCRMLPKTFK